MYALNYIIHFYIPIYGIRFAKLCFYGFLFFKKIPHEYGIYVTLTVTLDFKF